MQFLYTDLYILKLKYSFKIPSLARNMFGIQGQADSKSYKAENVACETPQMHNLFVLVFHGHK